MLVEKVVEVPRRALIEMAVRGANDSEWGYQEWEAKDTLQNLVPDWDESWEADLLMIECELGHREYGPARPPTPTESILRNLYLPVIENMMKTDSFFTSLRVVESGKVFELPLKIGENDGEV